MIEKFLEYSYNILKQQQKNSPHPLLMYIKRIELKKYILTELEKIALRTLILDIHRKKDEGKLVGKNPREQYCYYNEVWLGDKENVKSLLEEFPELYRLMRLKLDQIDSSVKEIICRLEKDKEQIAKIFCGGRSFSKAASLEFLGYVLSVPDLQKS